jgi:hypothetical protein
MAGSAAQTNRRGGGSAGGRGSRKGPAAKAAGATVLSRFFARPSIVVAGATFAAIMTGIVANALLLQKGHHPSPLFSPAVTRTEAPPAVVFAPPTPTPVPRTIVESPAPAPVAAPADEAPVTPKPAAPATPTRKAATKPAPEAARPAHKPVSAPHRDAIGDLIGHLGR